MARSRRDLAVAARLLSHIPLTAADVELRSVPADAQQRDAETDILRAERNLATAAISQHEGRRKAFLEVNRKVGVALNNEIHNCTS
jgi:hypothetical protein